MTVPNSRVPPTDPGRMKTDVLQKFKLGNIDVLNNLSFPPLPADLE